MEAPKCRLCQKNHWAREGCNGMLTERNIQREGRRVLKGSTGQPAKPTRTASAERTDPPKASASMGERGIGETPAGGAAKPRRGKK